MTFTERHQIFHAKSKLREILDLFLVVDLFGRRRDVIEFDAIFAERIASQLCSSSGSPLAIVASFASRQTLTFLGPAPAAERKSFRSNRHLDLVCFDLELVLWLRAIQNLLSGFGSHFRDIFVLPPDVLFAGLQ